MSNLTTNKSINPQAPQTVVQNDTTDSSTTSIYVDTRSALVSLTTERKHWETNLLRKSNDALYEILVQCFVLYEQISGSTKDAIEARKALAAVCDENNYRFVGSTPLITKVIKCVFGVDRRRVSAYSIVLREAINKKIEPTNFAEWVSEQGGVEQVRLSKSPKTKTKNEKIELCKKAISKSSILAKVTSEALSQASDVDKAGEQCVLLAVQNSDGSFSIQAVVTSASATKAALEAHYTTTKSECQSTADKKIVTDNEKERDESINQAIAA